MTRFAPPTLYQCPACAGYFKRYEFRSLFFDDAIPDWSDEKNGNWWASASRHVGRCPACSSVIWNDDAVSMKEAPQEPPRIGAAARWWHRVTGDRSGLLRDERLWEALPDAIKSAEQINGLATTDDFTEALACLLPNALDREIHLRRWLWWAANDHARMRAGDVPTAVQPVLGADAARVNMLRLLALIEDDPKAQVTRGELLRQLGRFDEAVAVLKAVEPDGYSEVMAVKIERLALARNAALSML